MRPGRPAILAAIVAGLLLLLMAGGALAGLVADLLWFRSLALEDVFWRRLWANVAVRGTLALAIAVVVFCNLWVVTRTLGAIRLRRRYANIEIAERLPHTYVVTVISAVAILSAWWLSAGVANPIPIVAALSPEPWNLQDPVFGLDASFYVFQWPILMRIQTLAAVLVFWLALLSIGAYAATGAIRVVNSRPSLSPLARRHLGLLGAIFLALLGINAWLDRYGLIVNGDGFAGALGYTDVHARLPAKLIIALLTLVCAAALAHGSWVGRFRAPLLLGAILAVVWMGGEAIYPSLVQRFVVEPNELPREEPYIRDHLDFTRRAYGVRDVQQVTLPYVANAELDEGRLLERLRGVPLWDPRPLLTTYRQRQALFRYYTFASVHHDRYRSNEGVEPVAVSVRELEAAELEAAAQTWQNLHLNYVAGEGAVVSPIARMADDGTPIFYLWDIDPPKLAPEAPPDLALLDPSIYFGERTTEYVILNGETQPIGVTLDAAWKKALFAWAFQSKNILLSTDLTRESKLVYRRRIADRVREVAPFLIVPADRAAQPVVVDGRIVWIVDGFSTSPSFPLAPSVEFDGRAIRYIRNSVKATVDALTGAVTLYAVDPSDPYLATHMRIFPGLLRPISEMPKELQAHLRFPIPLMQLQAQVLGAYHLREPSAFYEQQDVWSLATEQYRGTPAAMEPTYSMFALPGTSEMEFLLSVPFVPRGRQNMTALFVTRNDPPSYGEQILYLLPRDEVVFGPQQIEAMIDQDPEISQELALWRRGGSDVTRGHLIIVPIDSTLVYVEPLFLEAANAAIPQLERVILARAGTVVMRPTFESGVAALLSGEARPVFAQVPGADSESLSTPTAPAGSLDAARRLMDQADAYLRAGDWAGFGRTWESLRRLLSEGSTGP